jgi:virginiamycin B lyase
MGYSMIRFPANRHVHPRRRFVPVLERLETYVLQAAVLKVFPISADATSITTGPDGNLWFAEAGLASNGPDRIGRLTPAGALTEFPLATSSITGLKIISGPDGNLWFNQPATGQIGRITPSGVITEFSIPVLPGHVAFTYGITAGPDGNVWFTDELGPAGGGVLTAEDGGRIGRITPSGSVTQFVVPGPNGLPPGNAPSEIIPGSDGNLWFGGPQNVLGKISVAGAVTEYPLPFTDDAVGLASGPNGDVWFFEEVGSQISLASIASTGVITPVPTMLAPSHTLGPPSPTGIIAPGAIARGPDGNYWLTQKANVGVPGILLRETPATGTINVFTTQLHINVRTDEPLHTEAITAGPDGNMWFTETAERGLSPRNEVAELVIASSTPDGTLPQHTRQGRRHPIHPVQHHPLHRHSG